LSRATFDIANSGEPEDVYRANSGAEPYPGARLLRQSLADVFMFEGRMFLFRWSDGPWVEEIQTAHTPDGVTFVGASTVCEFDYQP
jgi:hypothetical protein